MTRQQKKAQKKRQKAINQFKKKSMTQLTEILLTEISVKKAPLMFKPLAILVKILRGLIRFVYHRVKGIQRLNKWFKGLTKFNKFAIKILNLGASGYGLFTKVEPFLEKQLNKGKEEAPQEEIKTELEAS
jgi:hypothetical protein